MLLFLLPICYPVCYPTIHFEYQRLNARYPPSISNVSLAHIQAINRYRYFATGSMDETNRFRSLFDGEKVDPLRIPDFLNNIEEQATKKLTKNRFY